MSVNPPLIALVLLLASGSAGAQAPAADAAAPQASPSADAADANDGWVTAIDLLTIGPGDHLWTSFGHTAVTVVRFNRITKEHSTNVYNWGDADFGGWSFVWSFFVGEARFRLSEMGALESVVNTYAPLGRTMVQQRFALTPAQVEKMVAGLEKFARPENREYVYHHLNATCATKLRDFLDQEILGGAIENTLAKELDPQTPRYYGRKYFAGFFFAEIFNDLFMGREHDKPWTKFQAITMPETFASYLQTVQVPDPAGSGTLVPLLGKPVPIVHDVPARPYKGEGRSLIHLAYLLFAIIAGMGVYVLRRREVNMADAGFWMLIWTVPAVAASFCMVFGAVVSAVVEGRINELLLVFPPTDVVLLGLAFVWWRGRVVFPRWLKPYAWVRVGLVALSLVAHATGIFIQEPRVVLALAVLTTSLLLAIVYRLEGAGAQQAQPVPAAPPTSNEAAA